MGCAGWGWFGGIVGLARWGRAAWVTLLLCFWVSGCACATAFGWPLSGVWRLRCVRSRSALGLRLLGRCCSGLCGLLGSGLSAYAEVGAAGVRFGFVFGGAVVRTAGPVSGWFWGFRMVLGWPLSSALFLVGVFLAKVLQVVFGGFSGVGLLCSTAAGVIRGAFGGLCDVFVLLLGGAVARFGGVGVEVCVVQLAVGFVVVGFAYVRPFWVAVVRGPFFAGHVLSALISAAALLGCYDAGGRFGRGGSGFGVHCECWGGGGVGGSCSRGFSCGGGLVSRAGAVAGQGGPASEASGFEAAGSAPGGGCSFQCCGGGGLHA
ncbi:hypothetical protein SAMN05192583_0547 [Sphingomonas gellani]|uniref:Uncharacterized protein n=1 Tax=Sphingomonas gellani TaxID=1166340 RepID=A0A1H7Z626_9SPHN|nr:hypothetical protein SAMN05192583_0547 [Sphingomonas gellani]